MRRLLFAVLAVVLGAGVVGVQTPAPAVADPGRPALPGQPAPARGTASRAQTVKPDPSDGRTLTRADAVSWPVAGTAEIDPPAAGVARGRVGGLPVTVARPKVAGKTAASAAPRVRMQVYDRGVSQRAGVDGPVLRLARSDGALAASTVVVSVNYGGFAHAIGGGWSTRLRLRQLPDCALTTPERAECRRSTAVATVNDPVARTVSAQVGVAGGTVLALAAEASSTQGDYKATKLSLSSSWQTSLNSGSFGWNYPIRLPSTANGFSPSVGLAYSSQTVDGRTSATNNQGSWVGEGFGYEPGYIERSYKPCADDGHKTSGDLCWATYNGVVMLDGRSGNLVKIDENTWKISNDDGSKVERRTGAVNGDDDGEYWKVTTTDGTQYFFGLNRPTGWSANKTETNSVWSVPVYGDDDKEPCNRTSGFADSYCDQGWRWNLDYAIDPRGNAISYFYERETNYYARGGKTDVDGAKYDRGGYLTRIDYGQRDQQMYTTAAPARVVFSTAERCIASGSVDCDPGDLTEATAASWPDVPEDRLCVAGTHCADNQRSPTFFTRKRLTKIHTEIRQGSGWSPVEAWDLEHAFKANDDNSRTLWLEKLTNTGLWGGTATPLPATEFEPIQLANRIVKINDNLGPLIRNRLATIKTDSGAQITINYKTADCTKDNLTAAGDSVRRCYPVNWNPYGGDDDDKVTDWFHKYVVDNVVTDDLTGGNDDMVMAYEYVGDGAWRKADPNGITKTEDLTWSQWRGYRQVKVRSGNGQSMPTRVDHYFMRGLNDAERSNGTTPAASVADTTGKSYTDHDELAGHDFESIVYNGNKIVSKTINEPWRVITHTQTEAWGKQRASMTGIGTARKLTALADDAQGNPRWLTTGLTTKRDTTWGRTVEIEDLGEIGTGKEGDERCTTTHYVDNPDKHMYSYVSQVQTVSVACGHTPDLSTDLLSASRTSYDKRAWNAAPTRGTATKTENLDRYDGSAIRYAVASETTVLDDYGRPKSTKDALGQVSTIEYTDTAGLSTQVKNTNAAGHSTTVTTDPAYSVPIVIVDPNDRRTDLSYDGLGRLTSVWLPDRVKSQNATPNLKFGYRYRRDNTSVVTTERLRNDGSYQPSHELLDGLLRIRQTQTPGPGGGWLLTDTFHNGTGQAYKTNQTYLALGAGGDRPIVTPEGAVNGQTTTVYDGADRPIKGTFSVAGADKWATTTAYGGDRTTIDPPDGGTPTTVVVDAQGRTRELMQYRGSSPTGPADVTRYAYTPAGSLAKVTDAGGNVWRYHYNQRNLRIRAEDPDAGQSTYGYDALGQLTWTTDSRGNKLTNVYDGIGRKTEQWLGEAGTGTGTKQAVWSYDNVGNKGQLYYSQRIADGQSYYTMVLTRDQLYRPTKTRYSFPAGGVGSQLGKTYDFTTAYNTDGTVQSTGMPAAGTAMPAEVVATSYDTLLRPTKLTGTSSYVTDAAYSHTGRLLQAELWTGGAGKKTWLTYAYERGTGRLSQTKVDRQGIAVGDMLADHKYNPAGNLLSITDHPVGAGVDKQCFSYDYRQRITEAWSTADARAECSTGAAATGVGGTAPYHHSWTFDAAGNRDVETLHAVTGGTNTVREYQFPESGAEAVQPHAVSRIDETGPQGTRAYRYDYDDAGNTTCRPDATAGNDCAVAGQPGQQKLTWDAEGNLASSTLPGGQATRYLYDADGNRIARKDPGGATVLYLPGMEIAQVGTLMTAVRHYSFGGRVVAVRNSGGVFFQASDHHNTAVSSVNAATGAIAWRRTTPYGGSREPAPPSFWPDTRGFLGGTQDTTGLTHLGAREYDPAIGMFVSVDPLIDPNNPNGLGGYGYGENNPVNRADPSGLMPPLEDRDPGGGAGGTKYIPLTKPNKTTYVDQNGTPHYKRPDMAGDPDAATANFLNKRLQSAGEYYDERTKSGSMFILQHEDHEYMQSLKGVVKLPTGGVTVAGTTADAIKVSWIDGEMVSVDSVDFTGGSLDKGHDLHVNTVVNKMRTDDGRGAKRQTQFVVFTAKNDEQAESMRQRLAGNPNARVVNIASGFDTGEMYSQTHKAAMNALRARTVAPRTTGGGNRGGTGGKIARGSGRAAGALGVFGDLLATHEFGKALASEDPQQMAQFMCDFTGVPAYCYAAQPQVVS